MLKIVSSCIHKPQDYGHIDFLLIDPTSAITIKERTEMMDVFNIRKHRISHKKIPDIFYTDEEIRISKYRKLVYTRLAKIIESDDPVYTINRLRKIIDNMHEGMSYELCPVDCWKKHRAEGNMPAVDENQFIINRLDSILEMLIDQSLLKKTTTCLIYLANMYDIIRLNN